MKQDLKIAVKLTISAIALFLIFMLVQEKHGRVRMASRPAEDMQSAEPGSTGGEWQSGAETQGPPPACLIDDLNPRREIRVLLTNPSGGYFFDTVELRLNNITYRFTGEDVMRHGVIRIQAGEGCMKFLQKEDGSCPALYPGSFTLRCKEAGIYVINSLPLEKYLALVVPGEMPAGYPGEALKSQAILARTYAVRCMLRPALPDYFADLDDTTGFQVYANCGEQEAATRAVRETEGYILCAGERVADVYYFSTSCGHTTTTAAWNRSDAAGSDDGVSGRSVCVSAEEDPFTAEALRNENVFEQYIKGKSEEHFEKDVPWYRWEYQAEADPQKIFQRIRERYAVQPAQILSRQPGKRDFSDAHLIDPGTIRDIRVTGRSPGGCASELTIIGAKGDIKIRNEYNIRYVLCDGVSEVILQDGSARKMEALLPSAFFTIKTGNDRQDVIGYNLVGGGFGHGIGMSQNGAAAMAEKGYDHRQIIAFFYPENRLVQYHGQD